MTATSRSAFLQYLLLLLLFAVAACNSRQQKTEAGICLSFDDKSIAAWHAMLPVLEQYGARVTFFVSQAGTLTDAEIAMLKNIAQQGHEIGCHGALHVRSAEYIIEHSYRQYLNHEVLANKQALESIGFSPVSFAYPFGSNNFIIDYLLGRQYQVLRDVANSDSTSSLEQLEDIFYKATGNNTITATSIDVRMGLSRENLAGALQRAARNEEVLVLFGHTPMRSPAADAYAVDVDFLEFLLQEANKLGLKYYLAREL